VTTLPRARARAATLVVVGPPDRLVEAADALRDADQAGSYRCVLMSTEPGTVTAVDGSDDLVAVDSIRPEYLNNAIAALRLSSLPTVIWWRGGPPDRLDDVAPLADRVVLDAPDAGPLWRRATTLFARTAMTDVRWARLTRWRAAMAHLFDLPQVRDAVARFTRLTVAGRDEAQCALFGGWLRSSLGGTHQFEASLVGGQAPLERVTLEGPDSAVHLSLLSSGACIGAEVRVEGRTVASRVVAAGDQRLAALLSEELRIRSRDLAFERAVSAVQGAGLPLSVGGL